MPVHYHHWSDLKLVRSERNATVDKFNSWPVPTLDEMGIALQNFGWIACVVYRAAQYVELGATSAAMHPAFFYDKDHGPKLHELSYDDLMAAVPYVRRLGYDVTIYSAPYTDCPFTVNFPNISGNTRYLHNLHLDLVDYLRRVEENTLKRGYAMRLHGTAPEQCRRRGLLKCVPRLLGWLRAARIALADPRRPGAIEALAHERDTALTTTDPPHWRAEGAEEADTQASRKRKLVDALHASEDDRRKGARWFNVRERPALHIDNQGMPLLVRPMRIEGHCGGWHYVFQRQRKYQLHVETTYEVVVLHHDAFDLEPWQADVWSITGCEREFARQFTKVDSEDDDDDDDDE